MQVHEPKPVVAGVKRGEVGEERGKHLSFSTLVRARVLNISSFSKIQAPATTNLRE